MKALIPLMVAVFSVPYFAVGASISGALKCNRCIQWCNVNSATDSEAEACLTRCLGQPFCRQNGKSVFLFEEVPGLGLEAIPAATDLN